MFKAIRGALSLALAIVVLKIFMPEIASSLTEMIVKILSLGLNILNQVSGTV